MLMPDLPVAGDAMLARDDTQEWPLADLPRVERGVVGAAVRAARMEPAPEGGAGEVGRGAGDAGEPLDRPVSGGNEPGARRCTGGAGSTRSRAAGATLDDLARVHDRDAVRELEEQRQVVRDEQHREAELGLQLADLLQDLALDDDVERGRRLVHDHELGPERERHRDHHALPHAAGQLVRVRAERAGGRCRRGRAGRRHARAPRSSTRARARASCRRTGRPRA